MGPPSRRPARRGPSGCGLQIAQPLGGQPFQQFRNRPGGHTVEVGAALTNHRGDDGQRVHRLEHVKQTFGDVRARPIECVNPNWPQGGGADSSERRNARR